MARTKNVCEWLDATAARYPDKIAFSDGTNFLTFGELRDKARRAATALAKRGYFKRPLLLYMEKEPLTIAAFLACAYSGNFYVPLDTAMPHERIAKIHKTLASDFTLDRKSFEKLSSTEVDASLLEQVFARQIDTDLLYVLFTSGSTGIPKGVAVQHRGVIDYLDKATEALDLDETTRYAQQYPLIFDASLLPIYTTLYRGATNYLIPEKVLKFPTLLIDFLNQHQCNTFGAVPTVYTLVARSRMFNKKIPQYLKKCIFSGEVVPTTILNIWRNTLPAVSFINTFGPTEITGTFLYYCIQRDFAENEPIPIGNAYANTDVLILNDAMEPCGLGETGELCVRGSKISCGYYNDPERTAACFVQNPLNTAYREIIYRTGDLGYINDHGEIMFIGRQDHQIKHAGHRIELGEIEVACSGIKGVDLSACIYNAEKQQIILCYCGLAEQKEIKAALQKKLQPYMIPGKYVHLESMPQLPNGKIDRVTLHAIHCSV